MTRYLCTHESHVQGGELRPVDLTPQVRLERALQPRQPVFLAMTERVIEDVVAFDEADPERRLLGVRQILSGSFTPLDGPVILASERAVLFRRPGMHELDDLRRSEPAVDRLATLAGDAGTMGGRTSSGDLVMLEERARRSEGFGSEEGPISTQTLERAESVPQGVFDPWLLTEALATSPRDPKAVEQIIRRTPRVNALATSPAEGPWRVVVTCPRAEGTPPTTHDVVFTGVGLPEAATVQATPVDAWDATMERDALHDLAPAADLARTERRLGAVIAGAAAAAIVGLVVTWFTGALGAAARETPGWLTLAVAVALASIAYGLISLWAPRDPAGNLNDIYTVARFYTSRQELLQIATAVTLGGCLLAGLLAVVPPVLANEAALPPPAISFRTEGDTVQATARIALASVPMDEDVVLRIEGFRSADAPGTPLGIATGTSDASGAVEIATTFAVPDDLAFISAWVSVGDATMGSCSPRFVDIPGCSVVAIPEGSDPVVIRLPAPAITPAIPVPTTAFGAPGAVATPTPQVTVPAT